MKKVIGIDLGTTNSVLAFKTNSVEILRNKENEELTRSCVGMRDGQMMVGKTAYNLLKLDPQNTILSVKRLMGVAFRDEMVQKMIAETKQTRGYYKYTITQLKGGTDDAVAVLLGGKQYAPEQISGEILKKLKADAEEKLNDEVTHAVITVPAYFTEKQKNATKLAAKYAGLKVLKLLSEPTAAAIAYGVDTMQPGEAKMVLIYDFGGGTFDLSILSIADGQYLEMGTGGDRWLGGDDIDKALAEYIYKQVCEKYDIPDNKIDALIEALSLKKKNNFLSTSRTQTEDCKIQLSAMQKVDFIVEDILEDENGDAIDINLTITRQEFEKLVRPYVERSIDMIENLMNEMSYEMEMMDSILLVGGTSCIPLVKEMLVAKYGNEKIKVSKKPMLAIAEGAAILAHRLDDAYEEDASDTTKIEDVTFSTAHDYFIKINVDGRDEMKKFIEKQSPIPATASHTFKTTMDNQRLICIDIQTDVEDEKFERQALGFYLIENNVAIGTNFVFDFDLGLEGEGEILAVNVYEQGHKAKAKKVILGRDKADEKALTTIYDLVRKGVKETKTLESEQAVMQLLAQKVSEVEKLSVKLGADNIPNEKWHEIHYTTTEDYGKILNNDGFTGDHEKNRIMYFAVRLVKEYAPIIAEIDRQQIGGMVQSLNNGDGNTEDLINRLQQIVFGEYGALDRSLDIPGTAQRILDTPTAIVGDATRKQNDMNAVKDMAEQMKSLFLAHDTDKALALLAEAKIIIDKYK